MKKIYQKYSKETEEEKTSANTKRGRKNQCGLNEIIKKINETSYSLLQSL